MKKIALVLSLLTFQLFFAIDIFQFSLTKNQKLQGTYSGDFANNRTIHFVLIKNVDTKDFSLLPFLVDNVKTVKKLEEFKSKEMPQIYSYHLNNETLTLVSYDADKKELIIIDFDLITGKNKSMRQDLKKTPFNIFRKKDKTYLINFGNKNEVLLAKVITNSESIADKKIDIPKDDYWTISNIIASPPNEINQEEFVVNGSISAGKAYLTDNNLVYTIEKAKKEMQVFDFDLESLKYTKKEPLNLTFAKDAKDVSNYFTDNKLHFLSVLKNDIELTSFDLNGTKPSKTISIKNDLKGAFTDSEMSAFIDKASLVFQVSTLTVNKTKDNNLAFRLDVVSKSDYDYNYNSNWWFMQQMGLWNHQQMMMNQISVPRGPAPDDNFLYCPKKK